MESVNKVRFEYSMALAAVMGLETPEGVSLVCCKKKSVSASCKSFMLACKFLNLPTLRDLAIVNAGVLIRQWSIYEPDKFSWNGDKIVDLQFRSVCDSRSLGSIPVGFSKRDPRPRNFPVHMGKCQKWVQDPKKKFSKKKFFIRQS